jgi:hypothetical protein
MSLLHKHAPIVAGLIINLVATCYTIFNPIMGEKLFTLYGISTGALYGYSQQLQSSTGEEDEK